MTSLKDIAHRIFCALSPEARKIDHAEMALLSAYDRILAPTINKLHFLARNSHSLNFEHGIYIPVLRRFFNEGAPNHAAIKREIIFSPEGYFAQALGGLEFDMQKFPLTKSGERDPAIQGLFYNQTGTYNFFRCGLVDALRRQDIGPDLIRKYNNLING